MPLNLRYNISISTTLVSRNVRREVLSYCVQVHGGTGFEEYNIRDVVFVGNCELRWLIIIITFIICVYLMTVSMMCKCCELMH